MSSPETKTPEQLSAEAQKKIDAQRAAVAAGIPPPPTGAAATSAADVAQAMSAAGVTPEALEEMIDKLLKERKVKAVKELLPTEPDYKTISEKDIMNPGIYIPVIEHDLPEYMDMKLKDEEYVPVWINRDQRQVGVKQAEGYDFVRASDVDPRWVTPLKFDSEGLYVYQDVVCMKIHKRLRYAKLRKYYEISRNQLRPAQAQAQAKQHLMEKMVLGDPDLDSAFASGAYKFYHTEP